MNSITDGSIIVQASSQSVPSTPAWLGEVALIVQYLRKHTILSAIAEQVRFARRRFGHYEVIDFVAVLFGYAISGERTLEEFYQHLHPFAPAFMALFGRERLPARSTRSRFLAALPPEPVEALRALFLSDLLARRSRQQGCGIALKAGGRSGARQPGNGPYPRHQSFLYQSAACVCCVPQAIPDASAGRSFAPGPPFYRLIPTNGSVRLGDQAMGNHAKNYAEPKSNTTLLCINFLRSVCC